MDIVRSFDHTRSATRRMSSPVEGVEVYVGSWFLENYPTSMDEPRESEIRIKLPQNMVLPREFYVVLRDLDSQAEQMRLYFRLENDQDVSKGDVIGSSLIKSDRSIRLLRPNTEAKYYLEIEGNRYVVTVVNFVPIVIRENGNHTFLFELSIENITENRVEFVEKFYVIQRITVKYILSKVFDNQFYQSIVGSILNYSSAFPLKVYLYKEGKLEDKNAFLYKPCKSSYLEDQDEAKCLGSLRDELDQLINKYKPERPDEYLVLIGSKAVNDVVDKSLSLMFFEDLMDFFTDIVPVYIIGRQAEYVGGVEKLFLNMFVAPPDRVEDYVKGYLDLIARHDFVSDAGYTRVEDLTLVKQGDFYLLITPIITLDFIKALIGYVLSKDEEKARDLLENFKEYQAKKIRDLQASLLSKILGKNVNYERPSYYFSKAIYELTSSDCQNSPYYFPFSSLLIQRDSNYLFTIPFIEEQWGCKTFYGLGDLFVNILLDGSLVLLSGVERVINTVRSYIDEVDKLDLNLVKELDVRHEFLMRLLNDLIVAILFNNKNQPKPEVDRVVDLSKRAFIITYAKLKYDLHRVYALFEKICYNPKASFIRNILKLYGDDREKFILDLVLTLRDAYFIKLLESNGIKITRNYFYLLSINKANIPKSEIKSATSTIEGLINFYYKYHTRYGKRAKEILLPVFRQFVLNTFIRGLRLPPADEIPSSFNAQEFSSLISEVDCGLPLLSPNLLGAFESKVNYEAFRNVPLPVLIYVPDRNTITVNGRTTMVTRKNFVLFSFTTPIITLEDEFTLAHHGHKIMVKGEQVYVEHEGNEHPEIIITLKYPDVKEALKYIPDEGLFTKNFNEIFNTNYTSAFSILDDIITSARDQGVALACANIQPMINPSVTASVKFKPGSIRLGLLTPTRRRDRDTRIFL
ncbi:hypothetical protein [Stygiolobus caldivivus]|uniref:Uncharacterized protein n=1 Tax=Stygiolobus caldivivus TaxID=2824673 RepID=A0A8D5U8G8_9CREN|nr:hypothetical protein [Stygiolobus caldivivus]BCU70853.1 hypothetical protein KN1_21500 [Stygiolobus caldivivus]